MLEFCQVTILSDQSEGTFNLSDEHSSWPIMLCTDCSNAAREGRTLDEAKAVKIATAG